MELLTTTDISGMYDIDGLRLNPEGFQAILAKLASHSITAAVALGHNNKHTPLPHTIDSAKYPVVYVTSDLHADFRKFVQLLMVTGLMATPFKADFNPYTDDIYDPQLIGESTWAAPSGTLLIIIGDLVDGKRSFNRGQPPFSQVNDPRGSFELLIFVLLYNLRIKAQQHNCEVRFTCGNHEMLSIIRLGNYYPYVHDTVASFFSYGDKPWITNRRNILMPFLDLCPYYILTLTHNDSKEIAFVHGGLHDGFLNSLSAMITSIQTEIDNNVRPLEGVSEIISMDSPSSPLWTRTYASAHDDRACKSLTNNYKMIIVGHCPTSMSLKRLETIKASNPVYAQCDDGNLIRDPITQKWHEDPSKHQCILLDCVDHDMEDDLGAPRIGFVDVAMSECQHFPSVPEQGITQLPHEPRIIQIMRLSHNPAVRSHRFYNKIERVPSSGDAEVLYESPALSIVGGSKPRRKTRKSHKTRKSRKNKHQSRNRK